ncbi:MAG: transcriptional regulator [Gammaproteobacteria bacterium 28-57-27]|nr:MAG: transcriptional regulator [Gammaproteobacteria bacterium 28-57-27]
MSESGITYLTDVVLITCVVMHGRGDDAVKVAREAGVAGAIVYNARGHGARERLGLLGVAVEAEKDVVSMVVATEQRDLVMHSLYTQLGLDRPGAGMVYAVPMDKMATYIPADVLQRLQPGVA